MKLQVVKSALTSNVARKTLLMQKNAPTIMFVSGIAGMVGTTVLACKATLKLDEVLTKAEVDHQKARTLIHKEYSETDRKRDHVTINVRTAAQIGKLYAPAVAVGVISVGLLTKSHIVLNQRNAALMAAYSAVDRGFKEYRARVRDELGEDKDLEFRHGTKVVREAVETAKGSKVVENKELTPIGGSVYGRFFDEASTSYSRDPMANLAFLNAQQRYANHKLNARGYLFLNEVLEDLGLPIGKAGQMVGWAKTGDGDGFVDFGIFDPNSTEKIAFLKGIEKNIYLDFNVDGVIYDLIEREY